MSLLPVSWYVGGPTVDLSRDLLGKVLVRNTRNGARSSGIIVETEAYVGTRDHACHAYGGKRTPRNETMYRGPATAYVYICYGIHHLFNVVVQQEGEPHAILVRALEPNEGLDLMMHRRGLGEPEKRMTRGPGSLSVAMGIDKSLDGESLRSNALWIEDRGIQYRDSEVDAGPRVGVKGAGAEAAAKPWRFWVKGNPYVSRWVP